jgi:nitroimidazol reductase NimA-like FMN-containing flavoprotein (pyridoxamine 5'-phosphate oxidase superfamily)
MGMRRSDRQVVGHARIDDILTRAMVGHLGLVDDAGPYVVPVSFAHVWHDDDTLTVYVHGAGSGRKFTAISAHPDAPICFQAEVWHGVADSGRADGVSVWYESVIGFGRARVVDDPAEGLKGLHAVVDKFAPWYAEQVSADALPHVTIFAFDLSELTAKANLPEASQHA